ncbi:hypothetical protein C8J57DRAFT_1056322 [Mycena rebaudengoi]|nr:hypothetical protein C8J57DRAFT_1056322 [Mycena rebaudengoi]
MAPSTTTPADARTAEFAKLFDLFEMLATRRSRMTVAESIVDDTRTIPVPADLEPVFRSLATVVTPRQSATSRPRRNTVAALGRTTPFPDDSDSDDSDDVESVAKFPLSGKTYSFTFKMMIHKLYQVDEWAQKVRDVLKKSQIEYKPLAEQTMEKRTSDTVVEGNALVVTDGRVHFKAEVPVGSGKKSLPLRRHSVAVAGKTAAVAARLPATTTTTAPEDVRAVKKRCIGRRKSASGAVAEPEARISGGWVYDAAISSVEVRARPTIETTTCFHQPRPRYQSLQSGGKRIGFTTRRIISETTTKEAVGAAADLSAASAPRTSTKRRLTE